MNGELVRVRTKDNVYLHGLVSTPKPTSSSMETCENDLIDDQSGQPKIAIDAAICIHGLGGNFYGSRLNIFLGDRLSELGLTVAQINTRGHDDINQTTHNGRNTNLGAAFEMVDDCRHDIDGWVDFLVDQGHKRIVLVGHSLGAIKSIYSQAVQKHDSVKAIVAVSASRLSHKKFLSLPMREKFLAQFEMAKGFHEKGEGDKLMRVEFPFPTYMTAGAYRDKYGPEDRYNWLNYAGDIKVPTLLTFGEIELAENAAFIDILSDIEELGLSPEYFHIRKIAGANHFYAARQSELAETVAAWLTETFGES